MGSRNSRGTGRLVGLPLRSIQPQHVKDHCSCRRRGPQFQHPSIDLEISLLAQLGPDRSRHDPSVDRGNYTAGADP